MNKQAITEGLLFVMGDEGLSPEDIAILLEVTEDEGKTLLDNLTKDLEQEVRGLMLKKLGDKYKLTTKPVHKEYYQKLVESEINNTLSQAALETLAIIAYNQPVTRTVVNDIRGVESSSMFRRLINRGFIEETGRSNTPGKPFLYITTNQFLDYFNLSSLEELPDIDFNISEEGLETDLYTTKYNEEN
jgi:segregation and condensation protein B